MKYCQGPLCHTFKTKDRIRGSKGDKHYGTRRRSQFYYGKNNFCDLRCMNTWLQLHIEQALDHFGRTREPKRTDANGAWYKDSKYLGWNNSNTDTRYAHYFVNDLLGERRPITQQQYDDTNLTTPTTS